jgi:hypothetical protein
MAATTAEPLMIRSMSETEELQPPVQNWSAPRASQFRSTDSVGAVGQLSNFVASLMKWSRSEGTKGDRRS